MSGLDKMKSQILEEASHSADVKLAEAKAKAAEILQAAKAEAKAEADKLSRKSDAAVALHKERVESSCEMQRKQAILRAKQEVIAQVQEKAYEKVLSMEPQAYFEMIQKMLEKYVQPGDGEIRFSKQDLERLPQGFEDTIRKTAESKGGTLTLSKEPQNMDGGFILVYGGIEENCTIRAMFDSQKDRLSDIVHATLFA